MHQCALAGDAELGSALSVAGVGIGLVFPTVVTEVVTSVPAQQTGVASGTNSALRELAGVFAIAAPALVFARPGVHTSLAIFVDGLEAALWAGAAFSAAGVLIAISVRQRPAQAEGLSPAQAEPATAALRQRAGATWRRHFPEAGRPWRRMSRAASSRRSAGVKGARKRRCCSSRIRTAATLAVWPESVG